MSKHCGDCFNELNEIMEAKFKVFRVKEGETYLYCHFHMNSWLWYFTHNDTIKSPYIIYQI